MAEQAKVLLTSWRVYNIRDLICLLAPTGFGVPDCEEGAQLGNRCRDILDLLPAGR